MQYVMNFWILSTICIIFIKLKNMIFFLQCISPMYLKIWYIAWFLIKKIKMHWISGIWVKFIILWTFQSLKNCNYFKSPFKHNNNKILKVFCNFKKFL